MNRKRLRAIAQELGRRGGHARAKALTPDERRRIAKAAIAARWAKAKRAK
jgi:hypothetical protein